MTSEQSQEMSELGVCDSARSESSTAVVVMDDSSTTSTEEILLDPQSATSNGIQNVECDEGCDISTGEREMVEFKVVFKKDTFNVKLALDDSVDVLQQHIEGLTNVPVAMQKLMFKGRMKDDATLRENKVINGSKIMVVGSTVDDVMAVSKPAGKAKVDGGKVDTSSSKDPLCKQKVHKTVLDKYGKPDDVMPGIRQRREPLPPCPISGMYNKAGGKVRLTFKLESDQIWIGTKERTEKISLTSIKTIVNEEIEGHEEYHLMGLQLGPTELSRYWIYWVPAQYVDAIKDAILGNWQYF